ncbi:MAG: hypothetical protein II903_01425 [Spirochaetales bacterium]|nr:hypothetical protein [Spirochaetales bacterium]
MGERLTKEEIRSIVEDLVEELRESPNDIRITTAELLVQAGHEEDFNPIDLISIHDELFEAAKANKMVLDMSEHENKVEGFPYNLPYIVHNRDAQYVCPYCGSTDSAKYLYGFVGLDGVVRRKVEEGKWILGGCVISGTRDFYKRHCKACNKNFYIS